MFFKNLIKYIIWILFILFIINISTTAVYLSSEPDFPTDGNRNYVSLILVLILGGIAFGCEFYRLSKIPPKSNLPKPKLNEVKPDSSQVCDSNESTPVVTKVLDDLDPQKLNTPKPPHVPLTPLEKGIYEFVSYLTIFTGLFLLVYIFYSRNIFGLKTFIKTKISPRINRNHILWRKRHHIIVFVQFVVTISSIYF